MFPLCAVPCRAVVCRVGRQCFGARGGLGGHWLDARDCLVGHCFDFRDRLGEELGEELGQELGEELACSLARPLASRARQSSQEPAERAQVPPRGRVVVVWPGVPRPLHRLSKNP